MAKYNLSLQGFKEEVPYRRADGLFEYMNVVQFEINGEVLVANIYPFSYSVGDVIYQEILFHSSVEVPLRDRGMLMELCDEIAHQYLDKSVEYSEYNFMKEVA